MAEWTLTIPAPGRWLSCNDRHGWQKRAAITRSWRHAASWRAAGAINRGRLGRFDGAVEITAAVCRPDTRRADAHNRLPTIKAVVDGLVDAGVLVDDNDTVVKALTIVAGPQSGQAGGHLDITIRAVTP